MVTSTRVYKSGAIVATASTNVALVTTRPIPRVGRYEIRVALRSGADAKPNNIRLVLVPSGATADSEGVAVLADNLLNGSGGSAYAHHVFHEWIEAGALLGLRTAAGDDAKSYEGDVCAELMDPRPVEMPPLSH